MHQRQSPQAVSEPAHFSERGVPIRCHVSEGFAAWLAEAEGSLAISTYQAGKVVLVGWNGRDVTVLPRHFDKPMGLAVEGSRLALACRHEVFLFANAPLLAAEYLENEPGRYDALYLPRAAYVTGDLNLHDVAFGTDGLWLANTRFSCLATLSSEFSFEPRWVPPFVSAVVPEDRCHLNGLAVRHGRPKFATAHGETDEPGGWRAGKASGGVLLDVESNEIVLASLSMPHSPRWHQERLWVLNSGAGELLHVEPEHHRAEVVCALPGYLRGLGFAGGYALVGLSQIRERHIFGGLPVAERFSKLRCGVAVVDLETGRHEGTFEFTAGCTELYDARFLPGVRRPNLLNLQKDAVRQGVTAPEFSYWLRPSAEVPLATGPIDPKEGDTQGTSTRRPALARSDGDSSGEHFFAKLKGTAP